MKIMNLRASAPVTLHFSEVDYHTPGLRRFSVFVEGNEFLRDYERFLAGFATVDSRTLQTQVADGMLDIEFIHRVGDPEVSAIEIERLK